MNLQKNIKQIAVSVLQNEAAAIEQLTGFIDDRFVDCVNTILQSKGRVVITGVGKSAIIANKIVATLNSTGTPSLFMHAADAIHGDLGMIQPEDVVICISKSGNTPEIKVLVPLLKRTGVKLIALVCNINSYLALSSDFVLNASVEREACPHNLAPTTSTTASLALGDALAVCLLEARSFNSDDFAKLHPGGSLGKRLYLRVSDIYPQNELPIVHLEAKVDEIIMEITSKRLGATAVTGNNNQLVGMITDGDLRRMLTQYNDLRSISAKDIMNSSPKTIEHDDFAANALVTMQERNITQLIVMKEGALAGFIHLHDLLREGLV